MGNKVEICHVTRKFKEYKALDDVSLSFEEGKIHGVVGRNGSGKTVLFKCICGFLKVDKGEILVDGKWIGREMEAPPEVGVIIENPSLLILDEPMNGLDDQGVRDMRALLSELKEQGKTIILASHNKEDIFVLCDTVVEMDHGRVIACSDRKEGIE